MALVRSVNQFHTKIKAYLLEGDYDSALSSIQRLVDQVFCEPINTAHIFGSKLLDDLCQEVGLLNLRKLQKIQSILPNSPQQSDQNQHVVYVVSKLQASGGHTAVLADFIRLGPASRATILVTGIGGITDRNAIQHRFNAIQDLTFEYAPRGKNIDKLDWLQQRIAELQPKDLWLFNHHQDSVAIAAVQPNVGYTLHFYHHGDHHLCLGVHLSYADHIDIHPMGYHCCRDELKIDGNRYLPMTVNDLGNRIDSLPFKSGSNLITCTAAGFNKVEIPYFIQYVDVIPQLLLASGGTHIHIGRLTPLALKRIRQGLSKLGLSQSAFIQIPFVTSVWKALHEYKVDLYITSFPYGGARTLIEVMGAGIPLAMHSHSTSRLLGTFDMAYEGAFVWRNPEELYSLVKSVEPEMLKAFSKLARKRYLDFHTEDMLINALALDSQPLKAPALLKGYQHDGLQKAIDVSNQVSCISAIKRFLYRTYRQLKSSWA